METLSPRLRELVRESVSLLGEVLTKELGAGEFRRIESLRARMGELRAKNPREAHTVLRRELKSLRGLTPTQRLRTARAFTLMLEVMNACENAFRSDVIRQRSMPPPTEKPDAVIYVLTAHPTEARSPSNIWVFHEILRVLTTVLARVRVEFQESDRERLLHLIELAWRARIVRNRKPRVQDEAEHIYSTLLRDESLRPLLKAGAELCPVYLRSWVGGDKDGHPGVDEKVFLDSLRLSRGGLIAFVARRLEEVRETLRVVPDAKIETLLRRTQTQLRPLRRLNPGDARTVVRFRRTARELCDQYEERRGVIHPSLSELKRLLHVFPGLVVPLEFRESSDVLVSSPEGKGLAIFRMLKALSVVSRGGDPRWYVRGFIISMASEIEHLRVASHLIRKTLGDLRLPVIPLFEQAGALADGPRIVREILRDATLKRALKSQWNNQLEIMLGYSDSSKESGVLKSRLQVAESMHALDKLCTREGVVPLFFQGSGGSTDRGGGSVQEQTSWWSPGALRNYKVTVQGEMVERSLANPEITRGQIEGIIRSAGRWREARKRSFPKSKVLDAFADRVAAKYKATVADPDFLTLIGAATPYPFLNLLKIGSRPTKRTKEVSVQGLRAIPWIMCWTQTRILFPTWWGAGQAWAESSPAERKAMRAAAKGHPLFQTYLRALGYTLAKIELPIWRLYLEESDLEPHLRERLWNEFVAEHGRTLTFAHALLGKKLIGWKPWLQESITLRSPMIHPLNLLQIIAMHEKNADLLRVSVAGISSGMMTTG